MNLHTIREITYGTIFFRLFLSIVIGGVLGLERGRKSRPAGLRTYILVCLGSTVVMMTNQYVSQCMNTGDPVRMGAQVLSGIGFIGAGSIMKTGRNQVRGITTAAGLWAAACIGLAIGIGFYEVAIAGGILIFIVLSLIFVIKNIVFDMGNVLVRFDPELFMDRYSLTGEDRKLIRNEVFRSVEWTMLDRGVIDEEIAEQRILPRLPERLHDAARGLIEKWDDPIVPVEGMLELLQALKAKGYRLYLLSNAATRQPIYWARAEASKLMDGALISAEAKLLKPDPQIYRTFLRKFALRPEECVFIDDTPINVEGALYENMAGIVFNMDVPALAESLCTLGVEW